MKSILSKLSYTAIIFAVFHFSLYAQTFRETKQILSEEYNIIPQHSKDTQYFEMISRMQSIAPDGSSIGWDVYHLYLRCVPSADKNKGDEYTCLKFTVLLNKHKEVSIPSLAGWKYFFTLTPDAKDEKGQVLGIDHAKFENVVDENGTALPMGSAYHVYNAFIDFHSMNVFSEKAEGGKGAQDLKHPGDRVIHAASFSEPAVDLGNTVAKGSYFKNGEVSLMFKGITLANDKTCALLEYDSGQSSFYMTMQPMPNMQVVTKGSSHYWGDIFKDLSGGWIQKANLHEMVVSQTTVPGMDAVNAVVERSIEIRNIPPVGF